MKQGILFDLDGTLWDSAQAVVDSWNEIIETLSDFHKLITNEDMCQLMGKTMDDIAYTYFNTVSKERALEILQICMDHENAYIEQHGGVLFPGLEEVLKELSEKYDLFIVSNCQLGYIEAFLSYHISTGSIEHVTPASNGGLNTIGNFLLTSASGNRYRENMPLCEYIKRHPKIPKYMQIYIDDIIREIHNGNMPGNETYPYKIKKKLLEESHGRIMISLSGYEYSEEEAALAVEAYEKRWET